MQRDLDDLLKEMEDAMDDKHSKKSTFNLINGKADASSNSRIREEQQKKYNDKKSSADVN
jgi:hypothetical protein